MFKSKYCGREKERISQKQVSEEKGEVQLYLYIKYLQN